MKSGRLWEWSAPALALALASGFGCSEATAARTDVKATPHQPAPSAPSDELSQSDAASQARERVVRSTPMLELPAGIFSMGAGDGDEDELPRVRIQLQAFALDRSEVTVAAYAVCVATKVCVEPASVGYCNWRKPDRAEHPINCVTWSDAQRYCEWRGARLPSEAEWEYAARSAGQKLTYPWGNTPADCEHAVMADADEGGCGRDQTWPVCSKPLGNSAQGICDLAGNVWEWVDAEYCYYGTTRCNPGQYVGRGGSWTNRTPHALRATNRNADDDRFRDNNLGFRCASAATLPPK